MSTSATKYQLSDDGYYFLVRNGEVFLSDLDEVAIAYNKVTGEGYRHGNPEHVGAWASYMSGQHRQNGDVALADQIHVMQGRFPLDILNESLSNKNVLAMSEQFVRGELQTVPRMDDYQPARQPRPAMR